MVMWNDIVTLATKIFDNQMYFMLDHQYAKFHSNLTCVTSGIDHLSFLII